MSTEFDRTEIELVALDGHRMPLKKEARLEAIKIMVAHNITREIIAWRLCMSVEALEREAVRKKLKLTPIKPPAHWTSRYITNRNDEHRRRVAEQKRNQRRSPKNA